MAKKIIKTDAEWQAQLTAEEFHICRGKGTEKPFSGEYYHSKTAGIYHCTCCDAELFISTDKFDSGSGWPSFVKAVNADAVTTYKDDSHDIQRQEVVCTRCEAHLGHVFTDGPAPTGLRFCINSVALKLKAAEK